MVWAETANTSWRDLYLHRLASAEEAIAQVKSGNSIYITVPAGQASEPLIAALLGRADKIHDVEITCLQQIDYGWFSDDLLERLTIKVVYASPVTREPLEERRIDYTPWWVYGAHKALDEERTETRPIDIALVTITPPNARGYCCFGASLWDAKSTVRRARTTIAIVNEHLPHTFGDTWIHVSEIDYFVENHTPLAPRRLTWEADPWDRPIAEHVASLIKDGDTLQFGTGSTTGNIPSSGVLDNKHDLGYFAELTVPGTVELVRKGVITSRYMTTHPGRFVTTTAGNSLEDLEFINNNPMFEFYDVGYIHDPRVIARNDNMVAINNAIAIDLTGQIAASHIGPRAYSGTGGHLSYALGAFMSKGGRYICVLPSTARGGTVSRIVPQFEPGQIVTVPRDIADIVVTEYGVARLLNKSQRERANELIAIAHPDFRSELRKHAQKLFWP